MKENFDNSIEFVFKWEGVYYNDADDPGGETKYGISKRSYPSINIKSLTKQDAKNIYYRDFWSKCKCDQLPENVDLAVFDFAVNGGTKTSIKILQRAIKSCDFDIDDDGIIGDETLKNVAKINSNLLTLACLKAREDYYDNIVKNNPKLAKFRKGWQNRINDLKKYIGK